MRSYNNLFSFYGVTLQVLHQHYFHHSHFLLLLHCQCCPMATSHLKHHFCFTYIQIRFSAALEDKTIVSYTSAKTGCKCLNKPGSSSRKSSTSFLWQKLWPLPVSALCILLSVYQSSYPILCNNQRDQFYPYFFLLVSLND